MFKVLAFASALAFSLAGCSTSAVQQFAQNTATTAAAIGTVDSSLVQLNATAIANTAQLASALAKVNCPIVDASVSLGAAIAADPNVAANVRAALAKAGPSGALASDICIAAGFGPAAN
jgi:hypothetical protein